MPYSTAVAREREWWWPEVDWSNKGYAGTKDGRLYNRRAALPTAVFRPDFISLTITGTHPRCDLAAISVVIDELENIRRDR
jgi:hypothetical protein